MGARDPSGGWLFTTGDADFSLGGPLGTVLAFGLFVAVAVVVVVVIAGLEGFFAAFLPAWAVLPAVLVAAAVIA